MLFQQKPVMFPDRQERAVVPYGKKHLEDRLSSPKEHSKADNGCIKKNKTGGKNLIIYFLLGLWFCFKNAEEDGNSLSVSIIESK